MRWWKFSTILALAAALGALGCGSSASSTVAVSISPTVASVITNRTQLFNATVTGSSNTAVNWSVTCSTNVAANTCGSIDATGLYTAPATIPTVTSNGTTTIAPTVTITAASKADTTKTAVATLTLITGISISITPVSATVGTTESFTFSATVNNPGCNLTSNPTCQNVTWSLSTTLTGIGAIGSTTGVYTAPSAVPSPSTVIITATSVADTSVTATATVTIVTASKPTVTSVSPNTTALGALLQDIYITGTNFISTENVYVNGSQLAPTLVTDVSSSVIRARIPDYILSVPPPSGVLTVSVSEQSGSAVACTPDASLCQITVLGVRPGVIGPSTPSISQGSSGVLTFGVDGGFFGTGSNPASPAVSATYNGQLRALQLPASGTIGSTRQLSVTIGGGQNSGDFTVPGLYPVTIKSSKDPSKFAVTNLAVQPNYNSGSSIALIKNFTTTDGIGMSPSDVAINPATGMAVVVNTGSNSVSLIDLSGPTPTFITNLCTGATGAVPPCPSAGPTSVSIDYIRNKALVVNSASKTIAQIDLNSPQTPQSVYVNPEVLQDTPGAIGINPVSGRALVAMKQTNYGILVDLTSGLPTYDGIVSITSGPNTRVAVDPELNWAVATPGGQGSLGIVDLNQQSSNTITAISRTTNVVTVTVQSSSSSTVPPLSVQPGDAVQIQNLQIVCPTPITQTCMNYQPLAPTFNGFFQVTGVGPGPNQFSYTQTGMTEMDVATQTTPQAAGGTVKYAQPVAVLGVPVSGQGIAINPETQQAVMVDPTTGGGVFLLSLLDQSLTSVPLNFNNTTDVGTNAAAYNPLTNTIVAVNFSTNTLSVIDPTAPRRLNQDSLYTNLSGPAAVAVDPGTNIAVVANQTGNTVSVLQLGPIKPFSITQTSLKTAVTMSSLGSGPNPPGQSLKVFGIGFTCSNGTTNLSVRLDGFGLPTACPAGGNNRELDAQVPSNLLTSPRRFALDVADTSGNVTNAEDFTVEQSVDVSSGSCPNPEPSGVSIDPQQNLVAVTLFNCNSLALINMSSATGATVVVGQNPIGVAVLPRLHTAVVANNGAGTASIVDELQQSVKQTVTTGSGPLGAAADEATGEVAITNSVANTVSVVSAITGGANSISTGQRPVAVAFNYANHQVAVADSGGDQVGISNGGAGTQNQAFNVTAPTSVIYDPVTTDCGSNTNGTTTNTTGCFIANSSTGNVVNVLDPVNSVQTQFRIGINPTAIAYNFRTSTLVSTNTASHTISVVDFLGQKIRAVLPLPTATAANANLASFLVVSGAFQYALDIHPYTNIAVIADTANGRVLFVPLPQ